MIKYINKKQYTKLLNDYYFRDFEEESNAVIDDFNKILSAIKQKIKENKNGNKYSDI